MDNDKIKGEQVFTEQNNDFYCKLRLQIKEWLKSKNGRENKWADVLLLGPDLFHLLVCLAFDPEVPTVEKARVVAAIAYFVSPVDLIPEAFLGPMGYVDDIALAAYTLNQLLNVVEENTVLKWWAGDSDLLSGIQGILKVANEMIGKGIWSMLKGKVDRQA